MPRKQTSGTFRPHHTVTAGAARIELGARTCVMGILNATPDSFSGDGIFSRKKGSLQRAVRLGLAMVKDGADILDVGGESSRPGARTVAAGEEIRRVVPVIRELRRRVSVPISIDTWKPDVAEEAVRAGANIINLIKGLNPSRALLRTARDSGAAVILMHLRGTPRTMQKKIRFQDLMGEIVHELRNSLEICLESGIKSDKLIVDPGICFGKTAEQNLAILNRLSELNTLRCPILIGTSRKSFIGKVLTKDPGERTVGTAATVAAGILRGAHIVRVHDVGSMRQTADIIDAVVNEQIGPV